MDADIDFAAGATALLQALALVNDEEDLTKKIDELLASIHDDKSRTISVFCEALVLQKMEVNQKKRLIDLLKEVAKWWKLLVADREKLLLTISTLEMEKEEILKRKRDPDPKDIYGPVLEFEAARKKAKRDSQK